MPTIDKSLIEETIADGRTASVQFSAADYDAPQLERLNELCRQHGAGLEVRFYGHYRGDFDASVLEFLPDVENLSIDNIANAIVNEARISELRNLRRFRFGVRSLNRPDLLSLLHLSQIEVLTLEENDKRNVDLSPLTRARHLRKLYLEGHSRGIASLCELPTLAQLTLRSLRKSRSLDFVSGVTGLRQLNLILGGRENLLDLNHEQLEFLHLTQVNGVNDLGPIGRFPRLKGLGVQEQARVAAIDLTGASLNFLSLYNCKSLREVNGLHDQRLLRELFVIGNLLPFEALRDHAWPESLRVLRLHSRDMKWNAATEAQLAAKGYGSKSEGWFTSDLDTRY